MSLQDVLEEITPDYVAREVLDIIGTYVGEILLSLEDYGIFVSSWLGIKKEFIDDDFVITFIPYINDYIHSFKDDRFRKRYIRNLDEHMMRISPDTIMNDLMIESRLDSKYATDIFENTSIIILSNVVFLLKKYIESGDIIDDVILCAFHIKRGLVSEEFNNQIARAVEEYVDQHADFVEKYENDIVSANEINDFNLDLIDKIKEEFVLDSFTRVSQLHDVLIKLI